MAHHSQGKDNENHNSDNPTFPSYDANKGFNKQLGLKRQPQKQHKSCVEI